MIKKILSYLWPWSSRWRLKRLNSKIIKAIENKEKKRVKLAKKIGAEVRQYLGIGKDDRSEYIPPDHKTRVRVRANIYEKFGKEMGRLNVNLDTKLKLS